MLSIFTNDFFCIENSQFIYFVDKINSANQKLYQFTHKNHTFKVENENNDFIQRDYFLAYIRYMWSLIKAWPQQSCRNIKRFTVSATNLTIGTECSVKANTQINK